MDSIGVNRVPATLRGTVVYVAGAAALVAAGLAGCLGDDPDQRGSPASNDTISFGVTSPAFDDGDPIPARHTCDGAGTSPPLEATRLPGEAASLALVMGDPDVPTPSLGAENFTHWLLWDAAPVRGQVTFPEGETPSGSVEGSNDAGGQGWTGPCPPHGSPPHRYVFTFFAVDTFLELEEGSDREELEAALDGHVVETTRLVGTYERQVG